eukprot:1542296-Rhodomonas_salina.2
MHVISVPDLAQHARRLIANVAYQQHSRLTTNVAFQQNMGLYVAGRHVTWRARLGLRPCPVHLHPIVVCHLPPPNHPLQIFQHRCQKTEHVHTFVVLHLLTPPRPPKTVQHPPKHFSVAAKTFRTTPNMRVASPPQSFSTPRENCSIAAKNGSDAGINGGRPASLGRRQGARRTRTCQRTLPPPRCLPYQIRQLSTGHAVAGPKGGTREEVRQYRRWLRKGIGRYGSGPVISSELTGANSIFFVDHSSL